VLAPGLSKITCKCGHNRKYHSLFSGGCYFTFKTIEPAVFVPKNYYSEQLREYPTVEVIVRCDCNKFEPKFSMDLRMK
jgi:hypothetical protein